VLIIGVVLTGLYEFMAMLAFWVIDSGLHIPHVGLAGSAAVRALVIIVTNGNPLPVELGVSEWIGIGGFATFGVSRIEGLAAMFTFRLASILFETLIAAVLLMFRGEVGKILGRIKADVEEAESPGEGEESEGEPENGGKQSEATLT
jgi:uncharacterized membrane protein YbhN (UPF0104 family)